MSNDVDAVGPTWVLAGEDGEILAATKGFPALCAKYPQFQQFLKMWHRVWPGARSGWPNYERELAGQGGRPALKLKAAPMLLAPPDGSSELSDQLCGVLIKVSEVSAADNPVSQFGLTVGERRVADMVTEGKSPAEIAATLRLSVNTVRAHMKRLFLKTGSHSRARLMRVLMDTPLAASKLRPIEGGESD